MTRPKKEERSRNRAGYKSGGGELGDLLATLIALVALASIVVQSCSAQTFHYSHGWTNGKRSGPPKAVQEAAAPNADTAGSFEDLLQRWQRLQQRGQVDVEAGRRAGDSREEEIPWVRFRPLPRPVESLPWRPYANMRQKAPSSGRNRLRTKSLFDEDDDYLSQ